VAQKQKYELIKGDLIAQRAEAALPSTLTKIAMSQERSDVLYARIGATIAESLKEYPEQVKFFLQGFNDVVRDHVEALERQLNATKDV
jgi:hypothetical protein